MSDTKMQERASSGQGQGQGQWLPCPQACEAPATCVGPQLQLVPLCMLCAITTLDIHCFCQTRVLPAAVMAPGAGDRLHSAQQLLQ